MRSLSFANTLSSGSVRERALDVAVLLLPFIVLYWLAPGGGHTIGNDYGIFSLNAQMELQLSLARRSFPLYVHGFAGGRSAAALTLGQAYHPLSYLAAHSPGYWRGAALGWNTAWRLVSLGATQLVLLRVLRRAGLRADLAFIASFLAVYNLRMLDMFRYGAALENYTGMLLLCAAMLDSYLQRRPRIGPLCVIAATYLLACGGHPQMAYLGFIGAGIVLLAIPFLVAALRAEPPPGARAALSFYARTAACIAVGVVLSADYLVPFYVEFVRDAPHRTTRDYAWASGFADSLRGTLDSFFAPLHADVHGAFGSSVMAALGLSVPFALAPARGVPGRGIAAALLGAAALVFLCCVGADAPIHHWFWAHVPLASSFRVPGRIALLLPVLLLLLLAWTFARLDRATLELEHHAFSPPLLIAQLALMYGLWNLLPDHVTSSAGLYTPTKIKEYPAWVDHTVLALGAATLVLAALRFSRLRLGRLAGVALALVIIAQGTLQLRYGTWRVWRKPSPTFAEMTQARAADLKFQGDAGVDMQPAFELITNGRPAGFARFDRDAPPGAGGNVAISYTSFNRLVLTAELGGAGHVALAVPYAPQWHARVDGVAAPVSRSKWNEVEVPVGAGHHEIEVRFESPASVAGMALFCITLAALAVFAAGALKRRRVRALVSVAAIALAATVFVSWRRSLYTGRNLRDLGSSSAAAPHGA